MTVEPPGDKPRNLVERAADAAMEAAGATLDVGGAELVQAFVLLVATGTPVGEPDAVTAGSGFDDARDLFVMLAGHLIAAGESLGLTVAIAPLSGGPSS